LAKAIAEIPLDAVFAAIFTTTLKSLCGLRIGWRALTGVFTLMTVAGASLGFAIGSLVRAMYLMILFSQIISNLTQYKCCSLTFGQYKSPSADVAMTAGVPILVVLMTVGIINPSGVDSSEPPPVIVEALKQVSPIAFAIKALCLAEYRGMEFSQDPSRMGVGRFGFLTNGWNLLRDLPKMGALALVQNGDQVLDELGLGDGDYEAAMRRLALISLLNLLLSWIGLSFQSASSNGGLLKR
jgi:hypothetical protein